MPKKKQLKLSEKHGLNPSLSVCLFCGEEKGLVLLGQINKEDDEAPKKGVYDADPCDKCDARMKDAVAKGAVIVMEMTAYTAPGDPTKNTFSPTGAYVAVKREALKKNMGKDLPDDARLIGVVQEEFQRMFANLIKKDGGADGSGEQ